jgi:heme exporter protein CcmD
MSVHWWYVTASWALAAMVFGTLIVTTLRRHALAKRRLAALDQRGPRIEGARGNDASTDDARNRAGGVA